MDNSELAECALSHVKAVASGCQVPEVILFSVIELISQINQMRADLGFVMLSRSNVPLLKTI